MRVGFGGAALAGLALILAGCGDGDGPARADPAADPDAAITESVTAYFDAIIHNDIDGALEFVATECRPGFDLRIAAAFRIFDGLYADPTGLSIEVISIGFDSAERVFVFGDLAYADRNAGFNSGVSPPSGVWILQEGEWRVANCSAARLLA